MKHSFFFFTTAVLLLLRTANAQTQQPFNGSPIDLLTSPSILEAENFDTGGEGISYSDATPSNTGGAYRSEGVDIETSLNGGFNITDIEDGEWVEYTINLSDSRNFKFEFEVASLTTTGQIGIEINGFNWGRINVPNTGNLQNFRTIKRSFGGPGLGLSSGVQVMRLTFYDSQSNGNLFNLDKVIVSEETQYRFTNNAIPGRIEAENFDIGGFSSGPQAFSDNTPGSATGLQRSVGRITFNSDVDLENSSEGGTHIAYIENGEWVEYTVYVEEEGIYTLDARVASITNTGAFQILFDGAPVSFNLRVLSTGSWQEYRTITQSGIQLEAGTHTMRINMTGPGFNLNYVDFIKDNTNTACTGSFNDDYSYEISNDASNPTITFNPEISGLGNTTSILYYGTGTGVFPGFFVTPGVPYEISATSGETINFYYTYNVPEGGERNSSASQHSFIVGNCSASAREGIDLNSSISGIYPNPMNNQDYLSFTEENAVLSVKVISNSGQIILEKSNWNSNDPLNLSNLKTGVYHLLINNGTEQNTFKLIR